LAARLPAKVPSTSSEVYKLPKRAGSPRVLRSPGPGYLPVDLTFVRPNKEMGSSPAGF